MTRVDAADWLGFAVLVAAWAVSIPRYSACQRAALGLYGVSSRLWGMADRWSRC